VLGELLDLALAQLLAGRATDRRNRIVKRAARLDRGEAPQPVGVLLDRQVQQRVGRTQVALPARA